MNTYTMTLILSDRELTLPVLPDKLEVSSPGKNEKTSVIGLGEIIMLKEKGLASLSWNGLFPAFSAPFVSRGGEFLLSPNEAVIAIENHRDTKTPLRLLLTGGGLNINTLAGIDFFSYEERGGETGDIYYTIRLSQWRDYAPRRIFIKDNTAELHNLPRTGCPVDLGSVYTVVPGDCLWAIARRKYGDGSRWRDIYNANRDVIGSNPNLIYPGQVFILP